MSREAWGSLDIVMTVRFEARYLEVVKQTSVTVLLFNSNIQMDFLFLTHLTPRTESE